MLPKHWSQRNPALSGDTGLNLREKTINCTQYYKNQLNVKNILEHK